MSAKRARVSALTAVGTFFAAAAVLISAVPASASSNTYDVYNSNRAVEIKYTVNFSSGGNLSVTGVGYDHAADGYGPYLEQVYEGYPGTFVSSCSAGNGGHCTLEKQYTLTSDKVTLRVCEGASGSYLNCSSAKTYTRP